MTCCWPAKKRHAAAAINSGFLNDTGVVVEAKTIIYPSHRQPLGRTRA
jgi:hypothetical protein